MHAAIAILGFVALLAAGIAASAALLIYFHWLHERHTNDEDVALPGGTDGNLNPLLAIGGILLEALSLALLVVTYPLRLVHDLLPLRAPAHGETPILLVHGWGANSASFLFVQLWLKLRGYRNVHAVSYTPPVIDARKLAVQVARHIERARKAAGTEKVHVIAHSMGGLLTRYAIRHLGCEAKVDKVITLGSPHQGTKLANVIPGHGNVPQMRYRSEFLRALADDGLTPGRDVQYYSIYSEMDNFVLPAHSAVLDGNARNLHVPYHGHCALLYSPAVMKLVEECLEAPAAGGDGLNPAG